MQICAFLCHVSTCHYLSISTNSHTLSPTYTHLHKQTHTNTTTHTLLPTKNKPKTLKGVEGVKRFLLERICEKRGFMCVTESAHICVCSFLCVPFLRQIRQNIVFHRQSITSNIDVMLMPHPPTASIKLQVIVNNLHEHHCRRGHWAWIVANPLRKRLLMNYVMVKSNFLQVQSKTFLFNCSIRSLRFYFPVRHVSTPFDCTTPFRSEHTHTLTHTLSLSLSVSLYSPYTPIPPPHS